MSDAVSPFEGLTEDELAEYQAESAERSGEDASVHAARALQLEAKYLAKAAERRGTPAPVAEEQLGSDSQG